MADSKISDLSAITTLDGTEEFVVADSGATKKITAADVETAIGGGGGMVLLADSLLGADTANFDFTSIPSTSRHLLLVGQLRGTTAAAGVAVLVRFNNDSGSNYDNQRLTAVDTTVSSDGTAADTSALPGTAVGASGDSGKASPFEMLIPNYKGATFHKDWSADVGTIYNTTAANFGAQRQWGKWRNASAITRVTVLPSAGNWLAGSVLSLYGLA